MEFDNSGILDTLVCSCNPLSLNSMDIWHNNRQSNFDEPVTEGAVEGFVAGGVVVEVSVPPVASIWLAFLFVVAYKRTMDGMQLFHCLF